jgi:hypothetical protein
MYTTYKILMQLNVIKSIDENGERGGRERERVRLLEI